MNRAEDLKDLSEDLLSGKSVVLHSPRRMGKTSLIYEFLTRLPTGFQGVCLDVSSTPSLTRFAERLAARVADAMQTKVEAAAAAWTVAN